MLEANGKGQILHPTLQKSLNQLAWLFEYITKFAQGVDMQNLVEIDSAVMIWICAYMNKRFRVDLFLLSYHPSTYPVLHRATCHIFGRLKCIMARTTCFRNHWCLLRVSVIHFTIQVVKNSKSLIFGEWIGVFKTNTQNVINIHTVETTISISTKFCTVIQRPPSSLRGWSQCACNKPIWRTVAILKNPKIAISRQWFY